jgi:hypothetical protein
MELLADTMGTLHENDPSASVTGPRSPLALHEVGCAAADGSPRKERENRLLGAKPCPFTTMTLFAHGPFASLLANVCTEIVPVCLQVLHPDNTKAMATNDIRKSGERRFMNTPV